MTNGLTSQVWGIEAYEDEVYDAEMPCVCMNCGAHKDVFDPLIQISTRY